MGDCYSVTITLKNLTKKREKAIIAALTKKIINDTYDPKSRTDYSLDKYAEEGVNMLSLDGLMRVFFAGWASSCFEKRTEGKEIIYSNAFDASYGWGEVMEGACAAIAKHCGNGSSFHIDADETYLDAHSNGRGLVHDTTNRFPVGSKVQFVDPADGVANCIYEVASIKGDEYTLVRKNDAGVVLHTEIANKDDIEEA